MLDAPTKVHQDSERHNIQPDLYESKSIAPFFTQSDDTVHKKKDTVVQRNTDTDEQEWSDWKLEFQHGTPEHSE